MKTQRQSTDHNPLHKGGTPQRKSPNKEEGVDSEDPNRIEGMTEVFIRHLARAVKDAQQTEKCCYHCDSPDHFIHNCPHLAEMKTGSSLNWKEGMVPRKGGQGPQVKVAVPKVPQDGTPKV